MRSLENHKPRLLRDLYSIEATPTTRLWNKMPKWIFSIFPTWIMHIWGLYYISSPYNTQYNTTPTDRPLAIYFFCLPLPFDHYRSHLLLKALCVCVCVGAHSDRIVWSPVRLSSKYTQFLFTYVWQFGKLHINMLACVFVATRVFKAPNELWGNLVQFDSLSQFSYNDVVL